MSAKTTGRIVGALFLLAFFAYGAGATLVDSGSNATDVLADVTDNEMQIAAGALLMLINSAAVVGIGVLVFPILRPHHEISAYAYLITRTFEAVMLTVGILCSLLLIPLAQEYVDESASVFPSLARVAQEGSQYSYQMAMIGLGLGSVMFCRVLFRAKLVPRFMAVWGLAGYVIFATGAILEVLGYGVGVALAVPGGLFEVAFGVLLIARGFPAARSSDGDPLTDRSAPVQI